MTGEPKSVPALIVVVDSTILFSAAISPNGRISELILSPVAKLHRISCYYAFIELFKHQPKIVKLAKQPVEDVVVKLYVLLQQIEFINEVQIESHYW